MQHELLQARCASGCVLLQEEAIFRSVSRGSHLAGIAGLSGKLCPDSVEFFIGGGIGSRLAEVFRYLA